MFTNLRSLNRESITYSQPDVLPNSSLGKVGFQNPFPPNLEDHPRPCKWLIPMVIISPLSRSGWIGPLPNGHENGIEMEVDPNHLSGMILQEILPYSGWQRYCSGKWMSASCAAKRTTATPKIGVFCRCFSFSFWGVFSGSNRSSSFFFVSLKTHNQSPPM